MTKWSQEFWLTKPIVAMVILIFASNLVVGCDATSTSASFSYTVRVQARDTGEAIPNAEVRIEVGGQAPLDDITDASGYARIIIDSSYVGQPGKLIVKASDYEIREKHINLTKDALPEVIPLEKKSVAVSPSPILITPSTPTATQEPAPTSTTMPTPTPIFFEAPRDLKLREAPSLRSRVVATIQKGSLFRIIESYHEDEPRQWWHVQSEDGLRGWTLQNEDNSVGTPPAGQKFIPTVIPIVAAVAVPATPTVLPPPTLISPKTIEKCTFIGDVVLNWHWDGTLEDGWFYSVRVGQDAKTGHPEEPLPCFHYQFSFTNVYEGDLAEFCGPGRYYWEAIVAARNEDFVKENISGKFDPEEVKEWTEISAVSIREYFDYAGPESKPSLPTPTDTPEPPTPTDTPEPPTPTDTPGSPGEPGNGPKPPQENPTPTDG